MRQENCPDLDDLRRYLLGHLSHVDGAPLEAHLLRCCRCAELAESLATEDALVDAMRSQKAAAPDPDGDLIEQVIGRLKELSVASSVPSNGATFAEAGNETPAGPETERALPPAAGVGRPGATATDAHHIPGY